MRLLSCALVVTYIACATMPAQAEQLVVSLSNQRVLINSNFIGEDLVLFGAVQPDTRGSLRPGGYDLVVTVAGPRVTLRTRRKARVLGIWVNVDAREFVRVPGYLAILSNRPVATIARPDILRRLQVGLDYFLLPQRIGPDLADTVREDPFRQAFVREQSKHGFYREAPDAVTYLTPAVFRAGITLPADVPTGTYTVDVKLFADGTLITRTTGSLEVIKAGFEQYVADAARDNGLFYGLNTTLMALVTGWIASAVFRRD
jgi:uncharacterized protein (TIGR02186 family)